MNILIKYLSEEPIENTIACLFYRFDCVVFYAYQDVIEKQNNINSFLKNKCQIKTIKIYKMDNKSLDDIDISLSNYNTNDKVFVDLTGCQGICSVSFLKKVNEYDWTAFIFNRKLDNIITIKSSSNYSMKDLMLDKIPIKISDYIMMVGGCVRKDKYKTYYVKCDDIDFNNLVETKNEFKNKWCDFTKLFHKDEKRELEFVCNDICDLIACKNVDIKKKDVLSILGKLKEKELIKNLIVIDNSIKFKYKNKSIMYFILDTGSIFERQVYNKERVTSDNCHVGIHLDWDGISLPPEQQNNDLVNEIDVLRLDGYILTFISCKDTTRLDKSALYELESVASRFGGKYALMKLACTCNVSNVDMERAKSMGINIEIYN